MIELYAYAKLGTLKKLLRDAVGDANGRVVFMLPSLSSTDALLDMLRGEGSYFGKKPEVWSWSEMYRALTPRTVLRRQIDPPDHRLILKHILDRTVLELEKCGVGLPRGARQRGFLGVLSTAVRELMLEGVPPDRLMGACEGVGAVVSQTEIMHNDLLFRLYTDYLFYLEENGLADNAQIPKLLHDALQAEFSESLRGVNMYWVGFLSLTGAQLRLVKLLDAGRVRISLFAPWHGLEGFHDILKQLNLQRVVPDDCRGRIYSLRTLEAADQYERVAREIALARSGGGMLFNSLSCAVCAERIGRSADPNGVLSDIGVLVGSGNIHKMAAALEKYDIASQSRAEVSVWETPLAELLRTVWDAYCQGWPTRRTALLLGNPILGLTMLNEKKVKLHLPDGLLGWSRFLADRPLHLDCFTRLDAFCRFFDEPGGHTAEQLLEGLGELSHKDEWESRLTYGMGRMEDLDFGVRRIATARSELKQKLEMMAELTPEIGVAGESRFSGRDAVDFLVEWSRAAETALPPLYNDAVMLYDANPPVLVSHRLWIMTDVDPSRYPGSLADHPLLDGETRAHVNLEPEEGGAPVHLPTIHEKREQKEATFRRLLSLGEDMTFVIRSKTDAEGRLQGDSPFLSPLLHEDRGWEVYAEPDASIQKECAVFAAELPLLAGRAYRGGFPRRVTILPMREPGERLRIAPSALDDWLACPFQYWCARIGKIEQPLERGGIFNRAFQGQLMHRAWQDVWQAYLRDGGSSLLDVFLSRWDGILEEIARELPIVRDPRAVAVIARLYDDMARTAQLQDAVESRAAGLGMRRAWTEHEYRLPEYVMRHVSFVGYVDRVDYWDRYGAVLVDYKLGRSSNYRESRQLSTYARILRELTSIPIAGFCYIGHADLVVRGSWLPEVKEAYAPSKKMNKENMEWHEALAREAMAAIDAAVGANDFPATYNKEVCRFCGYDSLCRRSERFGAAEFEEDEWTDE